MEQCVKMRGAQCKVLARYSNKCIALADPELGGDLPLGTPAFGFGEVESIAGAAAVEKCERQSHGRRCTIFYAGCSMPVFKKGR
jgi:hypothetical protein